jgi:4-amino-4-deoxy-L-arabinose transferase-like glycosyltransferase
MKKDPKKWQWKLPLSFVFLAIVYLFVRLPMLDQFVTVDEPDWLRNSGNFYHALEEREFDRTLQLHHPGVTVTWVGAIGYWLTYPAYRVEVREYFDGNVQHNRFLTEHNHSPIEILEAARQVKILLSVGLFLLSFFIATKLFPLGYSLFAFLLIALEPFYIGHERLLHLDALLSDFMLLSILAFIAYLKLGRNWPYLLLSGAAAGFAFLTKVSATYVFIILLGFVVIDAFTTTRSSKYVNLLIGTIKKNSLPLFVWGVAVLLTTFLFFPALWVRPVETLVEVYSLSVREAGGAHGSAMFYWGRVLGAGENEGTWFYLFSFLWRSSPLILLGLVLAGFASFKRWGFFKSRQAAQLILMLVWSGLIFAFLVNLSGTKADRYILPSFLPLGLVAGLGWVGFAQWLAERLNQRVAQVLLAIVMVLQGLMAAIHFPYYLTFYNPLFGGTRAAAQIFTVGSGEGLDEAARYLAAKPGSESAQAFSWYGVGPFSFFYPGPTKFLHIVSQWDADDVETLRNSEYLVIYYHQWQRRIPEKLLQVLEPATPEHVVWLHGLPYVNIYKVSDLPESVFEPME